MAGEEQVAGDNIMPVKNTGKRIGKVYQTVWRIERDKCNGEHPRYIDKNKSPNVIDVYNRVVKGPYKYQGSHTPDNSENYKGNIVSR